MVSEVFVVAWRHLDVIPVDALPWLLVCARHALANAQRAARRQRKLFERVAGAAATSPQSSEQLYAGSLAEALSTLNDRDRDALLLVAWEGLSSRQAAVVLGCSPQTFRVRAYRARLRLAAALRDADVAVPAQHTAATLEDL